MGTKDLTLTTEEVFIGKDVITETDIYDIQIANNQSVDKGKFIVVCK